MQPNMFRVRRHLIVELLLLVIPAAFLRAQDRTERFGAGGFFSGKGSGTVFFFPHADGSAGELRLVADFEKVLKGHGYLPGTRVQYIHNLTMAVWEISGELTVRPVAGPGVTLGFVRDRGKGPGFLAAAVGSAGVEFDFRVNPVSVYLGLSADLGAHVVFRNRYENTMTLYRNGLQRAWQPELSVRYRF